MLGVPTGSKPTWITRLAGMPVVHKAIRALHIQQIAERVLTVIPLRRRLKGSGLRYRVRFLESVLIADELFSRKIYGEAFDHKVVKTFIDLGSNVGYFSVFAADHTKNRDLIGLVVDGNENMARESKWHVEENGLPHVIVKHGVVGFPRGTKEATFFVNPPNVASSAQQVLNPDIPAKGDSKPVSVPAIDVFAEWQKIAGDRRIDLMKVDIEGFEANFIENSREALALTDRLVIEWHKWVNQRDVIDALLSEQGLKLQKIISEDPHCGVAIYDRNVA